MASPSPRLPPVTMTFCIGHYQPCRNPAASGRGILPNYGIMANAARIDRNESREPVPPFERPILSGRGRGRLARAGRPGDCCCRRRRRTWDERYPSARERICRGAVMRQARTWRNSASWISLSRWPTTGSRSGRTPWSAALPTRRDFAPPWSPNGGASGLWGWTARWSATSRRDLAPHCLPVEIAWVRTLAAAEQAGRDDLDILGQGSFLQMPVSPGARTPGFPGCARRGGGLGRLAGPLPGASGPAHRHGRAGAAMPMQGTVSISRGVRDGRHGEAAAVPWPPARIMRARLNRPCRRETS